MPTYLRTYTLRIPEGAAWRRFSPIAMAATKMGLYLANRPGWEAHLAADWGTRRERGEFDKALAEMKAELARALGPR
jgi:hypothetical protein